MANIFKAREDYAEDVKRSSFDLSHRNNFTTKIGQITPILCQECVPGDSFQIKTDLGLRLNPMVFPIQTPLVASVQYFKVPHRILWDNFEDFIGNTREDIVHPYIAQEYMWHPTGSLADYLGVPSTNAFTESKVNRTYTMGCLYENTVEVLGPTTYDLSGSTTTESLTTTPNDYNSFTGTNASTFTLTENPQSPVIEHHYAPYRLQYVNNQIFGMDYHLDHYLSLTDNSNSAPALAYVTPELGDLSKDEFQFVNYTSNNPSTVRVSFIYSDNVQNAEFFDPTEGWEVFRTYHLDYDNGTTWKMRETDFLEWYGRLTAQHSHVRLLIWDYVPSDMMQYDGAINPGLQITVEENVTGVSDVDITDSPFVIQSGEEYPAVRINALEFRAMEAIYNCYFRTNTDVDPFIKNGRPEYNKWVTNTGDGADSTTPLHNYFRNYELDYLTSAKNSPQQGEAPLVGVTSTGTFIFEDENGVQYTAKAIIDEDDRLTGIDTYDPNLPETSLHRLMDTITAGVSISDFRATNAFMTWLERNLRRGYRYKDQIMSHFHVDAKSVHYDDPQFLGGMVQNINVSAISSTTSTNEITLGEYGGQGTLFDSSKHSITTYCDEHCFIIGVLTVIPIPVYSQSLDPQFVKDNFLSYHFPEFNHISMQPIEYQYITPIESYKKQKNTGENELKKTFGYQRPQWDMVSKIDTAHGHMRTDMSNYLMNRYFAEPPELGHDFLVINPQELTSPFVDTTADADNIVGQIYFDISAQRPVSRMAIPRLEP